MREDPRKTANLFLIEAHYEALGDELVWTPERFRRLAEGLSLTVYELGALCRLKIFQVETYLKSGDFPPPIELHLTLLERTVSPSRRPPVFPSLQPD